MLLDSLLDRPDAHLHKVWGKYAGKVVSVDDSENMGRVQVSCPAVLGDQKVWALPCVPYAGPGVGFFFIPPVDAGVWVEFEGGDVSRAIWTGCYWAKGDLPSDATSADTKLIVTDTCSLKIDDQSGEIELKNNQGAVTTWSADISAEAGQAKLAVGASGVSSESASGAGKLEVTDGGVVVNSGAFSVM